MNYSRILQYALCLLSVVTTGNSLTHLGHTGSIGAIVFMVIKDISMAILVAYLVWVPGRNRAQPIRHLAIRAAMALLMINFLADSAWILFSS